TLLPMTTSLPTKTFCPREQPCPIRAPPQTWTKCQTRVPSPKMAPSSTMALGWIVTAMSVLQRQRNPPAVARRQISGNQDFQGFEPFPTVGFRFGLTTQYLDDIFVVH